MVLRILLAALSILLGSWLRHRREQFRYFQKLGIPGPEPNLLFGNLLEIYLKNSLWAVNDWHRKFGPVVGFFYGKDPVLLVSDPIILKQVLNDDQNFTNRAAKFSFQGVPKSVACLAGDEWRELRTLLSKNYTEGGVHNFSPVVNQCVDELLNSIGEKSAKSSQEFDISEIYDAFSLAFICRTTCGRKYNIQNDPGHQLLSFVDKMRHPFGLRDVFRVSLPRLTSIFTSMEFLTFSKRSEIAPNQLQDMRDECLERVKELRASKNKSTGDDLLTAMLAKGYAITDEQAVDSCILNLLAGFNTTSSALNFITNMLIRYPEVQDRLHDELRNRFPDGSKITPENLKECGYLDAVIKETLRMYPPVYMFTNRTSNSSVHIGDVQIPEGLTVMASTRELHYTEEVYSEPERFNPDRFLVEDSDRFADIWLPFGAGSRSCLGRNLTLLVIKYAIAKLVSTYKLDTFDYLPQSRVELQANPGLLKLKTGLRCRASPR